MGNEKFVSVTRYILLFAVLIIAAMTVMGELGIEIGPVPAAAGIVGPAVGFGAQNLLTSCTRCWGRPGIDNSEELIGLTCSVKP